MEDIKVIRWGNGGRNEHTKADRHTDRNRDYGNEIGCQTTDVKSTKINSSDTQKCCCIEM